MLFVQKVEALRSGDVGKTSAFLGELLASPNLSPQDVNGMCIDLLMAAVETVGHVLFCIDILLDRLYYPFREVRTALLGKGYSSRKSSAPHSYKCMLGVFSCFRNPPSSDVNYRIFNVRT